MQTTRLFAALVLLALCGTGYSLLSGSHATGWNDLLAVLGGDADPALATIILELRLPRTAAAFVTGALLALAGGLMQVLLRNPLADPYVLGISGGAACGALLAMLLGAGTLLLHSAAFGGALFSMLLVFGLAHGSGSWTSHRLLLTGVVVASGWGALIAFLLAVSPDTGLRGMLFWLMGDLSHAGMPLAAGGILLAGLAACFVAGRSLNILAHGATVAGTLGVDVEMLRRAVYLLASILTATAVTLAGSIGFVGLIVPHILRLVGVRDNRLLLPGAALLGGSLLIIADTLARSLFEPRQLPVGILTALIGVPLFLLLLYRTRTAAFVPEQD